MLCISCPPDCLGRGFIGQSQFSYQLISETIATLALAVGSWRSPSQTRFLLTHLREKICFADIFFALDDR